MPNAARRRTTCRVCGGSELSTFLDLGAQPPANALLREDELRRPEPQYPLALMRCAECELIQLTHTVDPDLLFKDYKYFSSVSDTMARHFAALATHVADRFVPPDGLVVELGSNDGILLRSLLGRKVRILGVDPAETVAEAARQRGVPTIADYFTEALAKRIVSEHGQASAVHANNVFAHIDDLDQVMRGVSHLLSDQGAFVIEAPYVVDFLEHLEFDTVYHEHVSYLGVRPLTVLFGRYGFEVFEVQKQAVHGGTIRVFARKRRDGAPPIHPSVADCLALEMRAGTSDPARLDAFARRVAALRAQLCELVGRLRAQGKRVAGYTAPAKATVLLNYCGFTSQDIAYLADATPAKQGLYVPGVRIPIRTPEFFRQDCPDYALLSAWNHRSEILAKESAYREGGGRFIIPIPGVEVV
jgi:SAM-dependent methyltransferase